MGKTYIHIHTCIKTNMRSIDKYEEIYDIIHDIAKRNVGTNVI